MGRRRTGILNTVKAAIRSRYLECFPDPAEVRLLELCGGITFTIGRIKRDGRVMTIILSNGKLLRSEHFKRVAFDNRTTIYLNDINQAIVIRGNDYANNVVRYLEQEEALMARGLRVKYVPQQWLDNNPMKALQTIQHFIYS